MLPTDACCAADGSVASVGRFYSVSDSPPSPLLQMAFGDWAAETGGKVIEGITKP